MRLIHCLLFTASILFASCRKDESVILQSAKLLTPNKIDSILNKAASTSVNYGKTIGVFGGSLSVIPESQSAKNVWRKYLNVKITDYGIGGYGFSSLQGSIQSEVDKTASHDIYILWASTNDYNNNRECGTPSDYTAADGYDKSKLVTQCGGINYCISKLKLINPKATIYFFMSAPFFSSESGYNANSKITNATGYNFAHYIAMQKQCCKNHDIKYLNQFELGIFGLNNCSMYYQSDNLHLSNAGYAQLGSYQALFLSELNYWLP
jgi:hypothetical protein